jgi:hypothetical protein
MVARKSFYSHICSKWIGEISPFKTIDDGWVTSTDQHPTAIMVLNGEISPIHFEQIIMAVEAIKEFSSDHVECGTS